MPLVDLPMHFENTPSGVGYAVQWGRRNSCLNRYTVPGILQSWMLIPITLSGRLKDIGEIIAV